MPHHLEPNESIYHWREKSWVCKLNLDSNIQEDWTTVPEKVTCSNCQQHMTDESILLDSSFSSQEFKKFDSDKVDLSLLPYTPLERIARILMFGEQKYGRDNWRECKEIRRYYNAAMRHLMDWNNGVRVDPETGKSPLHHAGCCILFMIELEERGDGLECHRPSPYIKASC